MRRRPPRGLVATVLIGPLVALTGCANDEAPADATEEDFCGAFNILGEAETGADFQNFAAQLRDVGTPADISNDGRAGFDVVIRVARSQDSDASLEELEDPSVSSSEERQLREFLEYGGETCRSIDGESGTL